MRTSLLTASSTWIAMQAIASRRRILSLVGARQGLVRRAPIVFQRRQYHQRPGTCLRAPFSDPSVS